MELDGADGRKSPGVCRPHVTAIYVGSLAHSGLDRQPDK